MKECLSLPRPTHGPLHLDRQLARAGRRALRLLTRLISLNAAGAPTQPLTPASLGLWNLRARVATAIVERTQPSAAAT